MLKSQEITKLISTPPTGMNAGRLAFIAGRERRAPTTATGKGLKFLDDLRAAYPAVGDSKTYEHPGRAVGANPRRGGGPLTPVELHFLGALPKDAQGQTDAARVPHTDARALAALAADISPIEHGMDARVVDQAWSPVKDHHDRNAAQVELANVRSQSLPPIPSSTLNALAEAVVAENPQLTDGEAIARANRIIDEASASNQAANVQAIGAAKDKLAAVDEHSRASRGMATL